MRKITLVGLGGTIESVSKDGSEGVAPSADDSGLQALVATARAGIMAEFEVATRRMAAKNSGALSLNDIFKLHDILVEEQLAGAAGLVVTTGTDTLEEVAFILDLLWDALCPLVVTGSMRHPQGVGSDAAANVRAALLVAGSDEARAKGCLVVLNGEIHHAWQVRKSHTSSLAAFRSIASGPAGEVVEDRVRLTSAPIARPLISRPTNAPAIALVKASLGDDGRILGTLPALGYEGLIVECLGGGSVPPDWVPYLKTLTAYMPVVYSTRTGAGPTLAATYSGAGSEISLQLAGLIPAGLLDGVHARILLCLLVASRCPNPRLAEAFQLFDVPDIERDRIRIPRVTAESSPAVAEAL